MKVFISWSGELSNAIAIKLSQWIPIVIQSIDVFISSEDIAKGENWSRRLSEELSECSFGIICLTSQNVEAPWIHFESGALAKTLDSRVSAFMVDVNVSDVKGPLSSLQNTKFEKQDFFKLVKSINDSTKSPVRADILEITFNNMWTDLARDVKGIIETHATRVPSGVEEKPLGEVVEEILRVVRGINRKLSLPDETAATGKMLWNPNVDKNDFWIAANKKREEKLARTYIDTLKKDDTRLLAKLFALQSGEAKELLETDGPEE